MPAHTEFNIIDLVHLAWLVSNDMVFEVKAGPREAIIVLRRGKIIHASIGGQEGQPGHEAFQQVLAWGGIEAISTRRLTGAEPRLNITVSTKVLLQVARKEEKKRARAVG